jgi:hypothetical protein
MYALGLCLAPRQRTFDYHPRGRGKNLSHRGKGCLLLLHEPGSLVQQRQGDGRRQILQPVQGRIKVIGHGLQHCTIDDPPIGQLFNLGQTTVGKPQVECRPGPLGCSPQPDILRRQLDRVECGARERIGRDGD